MKKSLIGLSLLALGLAGGAYAAETMPGGDPLGDKTMTKAEFQAKGAAMFTRMDANHDGKLDQADRGAHEGQMFDQADTNRDGALSRDEFMAAHQRGSMGKPGLDGANRPSAHHGGLHGGGAHGGMNGMGGMMMLRMADTNKDGAVSLVELAVVVGIHPSKHCGTLGLEFGFGHGLVAQRIAARHGFGGISAAREAQRKQRQTDKGFLHAYISWVQIG